MRSEGAAVMRGYSTCHAAPLHINRDTKLGSNQPREEARSQRENEGSADCGQHVCEPISWHLFWLAFSVIVQDPLAAAGKGRKGCEIIPEVDAAPRRSTPEGLFQGPAGELQWQAPVRNSALSKAFFSLSRLPNFKLLLGGFLLCE